jgi:uncharacterized protein YecT (DUF1311 family)
LDEGAMIRLRLFVGVALLLLAAPSAAKATDVNCAKADNQAALNLCAAKELQNADKQLNSVRKELAKRIDDPAAKAALNEAQKAWEEYRDAECKFESSGVAGAAAEQMAVAFCQVQRARTRINVLNRILECKKGDFTCPKLTR